MLKKGIIRRLTISSLALIILLMMYFFPTKNEDVEYKQKLSYIEVDKQAIYVLDYQDLVARVDVMLSSKDVLNKIKEIINVLTIKSTESVYLPTNFYGLIPEGTRVNNVTLENKLVKIDFSKGFLNTTKDLERKMLEAIVYSLTELEEVENVLIFVDGVQLLELPFSKEKLPTILNKDLGINKVYEMDNIRETKKTTIYYGSKKEKLFYYVPITYVNNNTEEKIEIIIEKLKSAPIYESNLISYLHANAKVMNYEILEKEISLSFNEYLLDSLTNATILEEVQYTIFLSLRDTYNVKKIEFKVNYMDKNVNLILE